MATKTSTARKRATSSPTKPRSPARPRSASPSRRSASKGASENVPSRAFQSFILTAGVLLLSAAFFGGRWGPALIGVMIFFSAFPPARRHVDRWLVGTSKGEAADQAAVMRMAAGVVVVLLALLVTPR